MPQEMVRLAGTSQLSSRSQHEEERLLTQLGRDMCIALLLLTNACATCSEWPG